VTRVGSRSFYWASFALEPERRAAAYAVYAFFRGADDAADEASSAREGQTRLERMRAVLARVYGRAPEAPLEWALAESVERFGIPRGPIEELLKAVEGDLGRVRVATYEELDRYCYGVASTVGLAMAPLLGAPSGFEQEAAALGRAMQLTNILRDVQADLLQLDRIYLPAEAMARHGVTEELLRAGVMTEGLRALAREVGERAHAAYAASERGIEGIAPYRSRLTVRLMRANYREILVRLEKRGYDLFAGRVVVPGSRKLQLVARVVLGFDPARPSATPMLPARSPA